MYAAVFGEELQQCIVFSQQRRYNGRKATGPGYFRWPQPGKGEQAMKISYKPLWKTLIDKNLTKKDLRLQVHLTTNHIANMGRTHLHADPYQDLRNTELRHCRCDCAGAG